MQTEKTENLTLREFLDFIDLLKIDGTAIIGVYADTITFTMHDKTYSIKV